MWPENTAQTPASGQQTPASAPPQAPQTASIPPQNSPPPAPTNPAGPSSMPGGSGGEPSGGAISGGQQGFGTAPNAPTPTGEAMYPPEVRAQLAELNSLRQQMAQQAPLAQMGYTAYQQQQQAARQQAAAAQDAAAKKSWFNVPQFDQNLMNFLERDPATGEVRAKPGAPPNAVAEFTAYQRGLQEVQANFWSNPQAALAGPMEQIAQRVAAQIVQQQMGGYQQSQVAERLIVADASWIFTNGSGGQLSDYGRAYQGYVNQLDQMGVRDPATVHEHAKSLVQRDHMLAERQRQAAGGQQQQVAQAQQQNFLQAQGGGGTPATPAPVGGSQQPGMPQGLPGGRQMSLKEQMAARFNQNGINDRTIVRA